jgi:hypothetical protein
MDTLFFVLGFLNESAGRLIVEGGDLVEHFFGDEREKTGVFKSLLSKLAEERGIDTPVREEITEGDGVNFYSRGLTELIDRCYKFDFTKSAYLTDGSEPRRTEAYLSKDVFGHVSDAAKLSFLAGVYARCGDGNSFRLTNAKHKAEIISDLLKGAGCRGVNLSLANPGYVPAVFEVVFEPSEEVKRKLAPYGFR